MTTSISTTQSAIERLNRSLAKTSLDEMVAAKTRRSLLMVDCSGSMATTTRTGKRRIDVLRDITVTLRQTRKFPLAAFGVRCQGQVEVIDTIPEPQGSTPLDLAIIFAKDQGANHLLVVTDGEPNSEEAAFDAARAFGGPIDTFFVGDPGGRAPKFLAELSAMTGGTASVSDLGTGAKVLTSKILLALGDGSDRI